MDEPQTQSDRGTDATVTTPNAASEADASEADASMPVDRTTVSVFTFDPEREQWVESRLGADDSIAVKLPDGQPVAYVKVDDTESESVAEEMDAG